MKKEIKHIVSEIRRVSKDLGVHPSSVSLAQLLENSRIREWDIRKLGGLSSIKAAHFPVTDKAIAQIQSNREAASYIRKLEKQLAEKQLFEDRVCKEVAEALKTVPLKAIEIPTPKPSKTRKADMTMEFMLSDIHYGKLVPGNKPVNLSVIRSRVRHAVSVLLREIEQHKDIFNVERLIIAVIGDVIESYTMHGLESAIGCEFGNPRQIDEAVESLWFDVLVPLAKTGMKLDFVGVPGNHDRTEPKKTMNKPGENLVTWIIYKGLERLAKVSGMKNVTFHIPKEGFYVLDIYGSPCLYEHTDEMSAPDRRQFERLIQDRSKQTGKQIHFLRGGHWHESMNIDRGRIIINESVPGQDGFSETKGYNSSAGQTINYYIKTDKRPTPFYKSFPVYLNHIQG
jgi:hypothetical protein